MTETEEDSTNSVNLRGQLSPEESSRLETFGFCFICFEVVNEDKLSMSSTNPVSLKQLCRYLKVTVNPTGSKNSKDKVGGGLQEAFKTAGMIPKESRLGLDLKVDLCQSCGTTLVKISELLQLLELVKMELQFCLGSVSKWIENTDKEKVFRFQKQMRTKPQTLLGLGVVEELRKEISRKANLKVAKAKPRVKIRKLKAKGSEGSVETIPLKPPTAPENSGSNSNSMTSGEQMSRPESPSPIQIHSVYSTMAPAQPFPPAPPVLSATAPNCSNLQPSQLSFEGLPVSMPATGFNSSVPFQFPILNQNLTFLTTPTPPEPPSYLFVMVPDSNNSNATAIINDNNSSLEPEPEVMMEEAMEEYDEEGETECVYSSSVTKLVTDPLAEELPSMPSSFVPVAPPEATENCTSVTFATDFSVAGAGWRTTRRKCTRTISPQPVFQVC